MTDRRFTNSGARTSDWLMHQTTGVLYAYDADNLAGQAEGAPSSKPRKRDPNQIAADVLRTVTEDAPRKTGR